MTDRPYKELLSSIQNFLKNEHSFLGDYFFFNREDPNAIKPFSSNKALLEKKGNKSSLIVKKKESLKTYQNDWESLKRQVQKCQKCPLAQHRKNIVFGEGNLKTKLLFIGEAPGQREDETGRPFIGRAGLLLNKMIEAMTLHRNDIFITNVIKCRPPENRNPLPHEIKECFPFLKEQIKFLAPQVICTLGHFATKTLLNEKKAMHLLRGKIFTFQGIPLVPTFHPAYLLRNPPMKKFSWQDLKLLMNILKKKSP